MQDDLHSAHISVRRGNILRSGDMILNGEVNLWIQMRRFVSGEFTFTDDEWEARVTDRGVKPGMSCMPAWISCATHRRHEFELTMWRFDKHEELRAANPLKTSCAYQGIMLLCGKANLCQWMARSKSLQLLILKAGTSLHDLSETDAR